MSPGPEVIAIVGAGRGGAAILETLLTAPDTEICCVVDVRPDAPGIKLAKEHGVPCRSDGSFDELAANPKINLIIEVTGKEAIFDELRRIRHPHTSLLTAGGARIIFHLLDAQRKANDRLEELRRSLEERIIERTEAIERANRSLEQKILDYEQLTEELTRVNEDKTRYLLQATHQLKAPFAAIQSYCDLILDGYTGDVGGQTRDILKKVQIRCDYLANTIKEMLELASLRSVDKNELELEDESLSDILCDVVEAHAPFAGKRGIRIDHRKMGEPDLVLCHRGQVLSMFSVIADNAIQYSEPDSVVEIEVDRLPMRRAAVSIRDHGMGIAPKHLPRIFDEYYRANEAVRRNENGSGLGLAIVKQVALIHNFHVDVQSEVGKGTTFVVTVPLQS